ncbi:ribonuclease HII [Arthrobacter sp. JSM 101049]|uniref:ribonuclease HII n=1 Tax=Arthrobacter sp. JSM 101049 TaxID=929097 RepID=UPI003564C0C2
MATTRTAKRPARTAGAARPRAASPAAAAPTLEAELALAAALGTGTGDPWLVAGCDEVGRGALAGPVSVGMVVIDPAAAALLEGVRDSKLLSAAVRQELVPVIREWAAAWGVGHASAAEIDEHGLVTALRLAGNRAWEAAAATARPHAVLLDGNLDWLSAPEQEDLFATGSLPSCPFDASGARVTTRIKGDLTCLSVAAASVLAKVERDALMATYDELEPGYGWAVNKGYGTAAHRQAIVESGASSYHRRSWRLTGPAGDR